MELKFNILDWWNKRKAKKQSEEQAYREAQRPIYRGQALKLQGRSEDDTGISHRFRPASKA